MFSFGNVFNIMASIASHEVNFIMHTVIIYTSLGNITIELDDKATPETTKNFLSYINDEFYNGTIFHRVIKNFMIQGGGLTSSMQPKVDKGHIRNEANYGSRNLTGTISMARTGDPHSATCQFFINLADNDFLDFQAETGEGWGYCTFGKVVDGMDIVKAIGNVATSEKDGYQDVPTTTVTIDRIG